MKKVLILLVLALVSLSACHIKHGDPDCDHCPLWFVDYTCYGPDDPRWVAEQKRKAEQNAFREQTLHESAPRVQ